MLIKYLLLIITFDIFTLFLLTNILNNKKINKLQKKINNNKPINNIKDLIKKLKKGLFILFIIPFIQSCSSNYKVYIPLQNYTQEEQNEIINFLEQNNNQLINKVVIDYYNLRELVRIGNR